MREFIFGTLDRRSAGTRAGRRFAAQMRLSYAEGRGKKWRNVLSIFRRETGKWLAQVKWSTLHAAGSTERAIAIIGSPRFFAAIFHTRFEMKCRE